MTSRSNSENKKTPEDLVFDKIKNPPISSRPILMPMIKRIMPTNVQDIIGVQPMTVDTSEVLKISIKDNTLNKTND